jgi:hypothetical protein
MGSNLVQNALVGWHWSTSTRICQNCQSVAGIVNENSIMVLFTYDYDRPCGDKQEQDD